MRSSQSASLDASGGAAGPVLRPSPGDIGSGSRCPAPPGDAASLRGSVAALRGPDPDSGPGWAGSRSGAHPWRLRPGRHRVRRPCLGRRHLRRRCRRSRRRHLRGRTRRWLPPAGTRHRGRGSRWERRRRLPSRWRLSRRRKLVRLGLGRRVTALGLGGLSSRASRETVLCRPLGRRGPWAAHRARPRIVLSLGPWHLLISRIQLHRPMIRCRWIVGPPA